MEEWLMYSILALIVFGFWGFFPKLAGNYISPKSVMLYEVLGAIIIGMGVLFLVNFKPETHPYGILFGILTGIAATLGSLFYIFAVRYKQVSIVVTMTALYPVITILLAFLFLNESITIRQGIGMVFALIAIVLFSL
ncbi:EamA family transporter [Candidatus Woesearchaeota archaeon]|nr:EamA family transporter [Candidatus Woesearchaeota archaeon]